MENGSLFQVKINQLSIAIYKVLKLNLFFLLCNPWLAINILFVPLSNRTYFFFLLSLVLAFPAVKAIFENTEEKELTFQKLFRSYRQHFFKSIGTGFLNTLVLGVLLFNIANGPFVHQMYYPVFHNQLFLFPILFMLFLFIAAFNSLLQLKLPDDYSVGSKFLSSYFYILQHPTLLVYGILLSLIVVMEIFIVPAPLLISLGVGVDLLFINKLLTFKLKSKENHYGNIRSNQKN